MLNGLDLFSGIGGNSLALDEWINTVAYCEGDRHAQAVLLSRMLEGSLPSRPIWDDVRTLRGSFLPPIDIIVGGFPCQDISVAGKGAGLSGERSGLFYEIVRLAKEIKPTFLFLENVPAIRTRGLGAVIQELTSIGYDCRWTMLSAAEVGAPHIRNRWFLLAHAHGLRKQPKQDTEWLSPNWSRNSSTNESKWREDTFTENWWKFEPNVGRVANGIPFWVDRISRLGNAVVPLQSREAFKELMGISSSV